MKLKVIDLFCGPGGAAAGLERAGFDIITGIDNKPRREYPYDFWLGDVFKVKVSYLRQFDLIWASPPCQAYSPSTASIRKLKGKKYPDLVSRTRELLMESGKPYIIENVAGAPIRQDLILCGEMFGLRIIRHRYFELHGFRCRQPEHRKHRGLVHDGHYITAAGHGGHNAPLVTYKRRGFKGNTMLEIWQEALDIHHVNNKIGLAQCVPPAYSEYIGKEFLIQYLKRT